MISNDLKQRLKAVTLALDSLGTDVEGMLAFDAPAAYKRVPLLTSVAAKFRFGDLSFKEVTWVNGGEDFFICGLSYFASITDDAAPTDAYAPGNLGALDTDNGQVLKGLTSAPMVIQPRIQLDFMWNYRVISTGANYGSIANGTTFLPRQMLGNRERGNSLEFDSPLRLRGGDAIAFQIKPIWYNEIAAPFSTSTTRYNVEMLPWGYRTGSMAASAFDREVEG